MLEGTCSAGEILFVPRGVCAHACHSHIEEVSTAHVLLLLTSCVLLQGGGTLRSTWR
jgi:hypothetical protein